MIDNLVREQCCIYYHCLYNINYWCQCQFDNITPNDGDCNRLIEAKEDHKLYIEGE